ncbi:RHS repeat-associated core domain-containing protein [Myxococcus sp. RHSTA-1-4]|uniref:RHS repeat-associated core domain-containing protein n=1 Tax=Myxococcus sp. RHSTA-1-4 TaxID=2874601 RepID=UPI001CBCBF58|nr:RHS repeat-associated core domain-containing protein [Myxococcus sp. RHSTA-1-4]MBZ4422960.1 RHS repeat-associated core domain-containing protein [Myxococcus sp. RHSTA-1-4]
MSRAVCLLLVGLVSTSALAQSAVGKAPWEEYGKRIKASEAVSPLGPNLFGDQVSLSNGALSFSLTDVSLPGNSGLPVAFTRSYQVRDWRHRKADGMMLDWDVDAPSISGVYATEWLASDGSGNRCSVGGPAPSPMQGVSASDFWQGGSLDIPGVSGGELLRTQPGTQVPASGGPYVWMTNDQVHISCLTTIKNGTGEGFLATTPDGTRYWFDWMAQHHEPPLRRGSTMVLPGGTNLQAEIQIRRNILYATRVEDRFGNVVTYTYTNAANQRARLTQVSANDGRQLTLSYNSQGAVSSVSDGTRTWTYTYGTTASGRGTLTQVTLPDTSKWTINFSAFTNAEILYTEVFLLGEIYRSCLNNETPLNYDLQAVGTVTHPSGAVGTFTTSIVEHGRSRVPLSCNNVTTWVGYPNGTGNDTNDDSAFWPFEYDAFTLKSKHVTGPGLTPAQWDYSYTSGRNFHMYPGTTRTYPVCTIGFENCMKPPCTSDSCAGRSTTTVTGPGGEWVRYKHGNTYRYDEGKLISVEVGTSADNILRTTTHTYDLSMTDGVYKARWGLGQRANGDSFPNEYHRPLLKTVIRQQDTAFTWQANSFDSFARPTGTTRFSSLGDSRTDTTTYYDHLSKWVLGQVATTANTDLGRILSKTEYNTTTALPLRFYGAGTVDSSAPPLLMQTLTYNADGTIATATDGNNRTTTLSNWYRGVPRNIQFADGTTRSATVDALGQIRGVTDENGFTTSYDYDAGGRLSNITYPAGDSVAWAPTAISYAQVASSEYGIPAGHWRQTVSRGDYRKLTYFDAMWRPLVERELDNANSSGTQRFKRFNYHPTGKPSFASYPGTSSSLSTGTWTDYDVLGRPTAVRQDSELGQLVTQYQYLTNFQTRVTNPRGKVTTTSFQAFDQPDTSAPDLIVAPLGITTTFYRNVLGMTERVRRTGSWSGGSQDLDRRYVHDPRLRLCKSIVPEEGATHFEYDAMGNLLRSADGSTLTSLSCDAASVPLSDKTVRTYDARNRLRTLSYPDGTNDATYTYTPDGKLASLSSDGSVWTYQYNKRRLLTREKLFFYSDYIHDYSYDTLGNLSAINNTQVHIDYAPNALGQPTRAGAYATGVQYFPNGAIKQFTYGNGIVHTLTQNARQLPHVSTDSYSGNRVFELRNTYDANGNVTRIEDLANTARDRAMTHDDLDRLTQASAPGIWGTANYTYDALDNLRTSSLGTTQYTYAYDTTTNLPTSVTRSGSPAWSYSVDARGNITADGRNTYSFTRANRLASVVGKESYQYDGHGRRIVIWRADGTGAVPVYALDGKLRLTADNRKAGATTHVYLGNHVVADVFFRWSDGALTPSYKHTDALGSPIATTDANRAVLDRTEYAPYGLPVSGGVDGIGFTGHAMDAATGLVYMQQRYQDPMLGRFLSADPVKTDSNTGESFNRYAYAGNNPYRYVDPDGRDFRDSMLLFFGINPNERSVYTPIPGASRGDKEFMAVVAAPAVLGATGGALAATGTVATGATLVRTAVAGAETAVQQAASTRAGVAVAQNADKIGVVVDAVAMDVANVDGPPDMSPTGVIAAAVVQTVNYLKAEASELMSVASGAVAAPPPDKKQPKLDEEFR